jgi:hypothetical protein
MWADAIEASKTPDVFNERTATRYAIQLPSTLSRLALCIEPTPSYKYSVPRQRNKRNNEQQVYRRCLRVCPSAFASALHLRCSVDRNGVAGK